MIKILDRYILKKFLTGLFGTVFAFTIIVFVVDFVERGWRMIERYNVPMQTMAMYYINYLPFYVILAFPVAMLVSTLFSLGSLAKNRELDVMKASGLSLYRIAAPVLTAAFIISIVIMLFAEFVLTQTERRKDEIRNYQIEKRPPVSKMARKNIKVTGEDGWIVLGDNYDIGTQTAQGVRIHHIQNNRIEKTITAERMVNSDSGWVLVKGSSQDFVDTLNNGGFAQFDTLFTPFLTQTPDMMAELPIPPRQVNFFQLQDRSGKTAWRGGF